MQPKCALFTGSEQQCRKFLAEREKMLKRFWALKGLSVCVCMLVHVFLCVCVCVCACNTCMHRTYKLSEMILMTETKLSCFSKLYVDISEDSCYQLVCGISDGGKFPAYKRMKTSQNSSG